MTQDKIIELVKKAGAIRLFDKEKEKYALIGNDAIIKFVELILASQAQTTSQDADWLWLQLMNYCKLKRWNPARENDLFSIVTRLRDLQGGAGISQLHETTDEKAKPTVREAIDDAISKDKQ